MIACSGAAAFELGFAPAAAALLSLGPQNTLLLRRSFSGRHALIVFGTCYGCELGLVLFGTLGLGTVAVEMPAVSVVLRAAGVVYLLVVALRCFARALVAKPAAATDGGGRPFRVVFTALTVSAFNPLAWVESVLVIGAAASSVPGNLAIIVAIGASLGALCRFGLLGLGGQLLRPMFDRSQLRRAFDAAAGTVMVGMALVLVLTLLV